MPFIIGETIGPYRLVEQRGQGGMATVFKAYHPALDRYVAIKALHPMKTKAPDQAIPILDELKNDQNQPMWIWDEARRIEENKP